MRPLELSLRNFRSYFGGDNAFDFRGRGLVGVVGPIGSGKSSLLDAISFALYGKTSAAGANTKSLIHQRAGDGGVMLRFEVEGEIWEVVRSLRRKGASQHALYRYEGDGDAEPAEKITMEGEVNDTIARLLGLDYDAFSRSVLLAQGRFAEFLSSRPAERDAVLKGVFGHDRIDSMRDIAKQRTSELAAALGQLRVRTEQLERVAVRLAETRTQLESAEARLELLRKLEPRIHDLDTQIAAASEQAAQSAARREALEPYSARLPVLHLTEELVAQAEQSGAERVRMADALEAAQAEVVAAEEALSGVERSEERRRLEEAAGLLAAAEPQRRAVQEAGARNAARLRRVEELKSAHERAQLAWTNAQARLQAAEEDLAAASAAEAATAARLHAAEHADMAASLRRELSVGQTCPVCAQEVATIPSGDTGSTVAAAAVAAQEATRLRAGAEAVRSAAASELSAAEQQLEATAASLALAETESLAGAERHRAAETELLETTDRLSELLGAGDPTELLASARDQVAAQEARLNDARRAVEQVRNQHDQAIRDEQEVAKRLSGLRIQVADLAARLGVDLVVASDDAEAIGAAAVRLLTDWQEELSRLSLMNEQAQAAHISATDERKSLLTEAGVEGDFAAALGAAGAAAAHLEEQVRRDAAEIDAAEDLLAQQELLEADLARFERLVADLTNARFVRFLLDDERNRLARLGSTHFSRLSSGRYEFTEDGTFSIVDLTAADAVRKSSSLSGGETFLASLALALSLAEMVTRTGGRLDAFFLDEGFGSLDPEHLDLAMEGIEALIAGDSSRLVVAVSHVPELRERIEDLIVLDRDPLTGDTRIRRS